ILRISEASLPESITTGHEDPVNDFFIPLLSSSKTFDVAVGYFTSGWLKDTAEGMAIFARNGGISRWVVSPELESNDAVSIVGEARAGYEVFGDFHERNLLELIKSLKIETRRELCALVGAGVLN